MTRLLFSIALIIFSAGCSKLANLNELLTLKSVADSQAAMAKDVAATNKLFDQLAAAIKSGAIKDYSSQDKIRKQFGVPILEKQESKDDEMYTVWLYRYATEFFNSDKVYLYFNSSGTLQLWEFVEGKETAKVGN